MTDNQELFMPLPPTTFRELVLQLLYSFLFGHGEKEDLISLLMHENRITRKYALRAWERAQEIVHQYPLLAQQIASLSQEYAWERIQTMEKAILCLGAYEIAHDEEIPYEVAIAEAIRLAAKYSTPSAATLVNALLSAFEKKRSVA